MTRFYLLMAATAVLCAGLVISCTQQSQPAKSAAAPQAAASPQATPSAQPAPTTQVASNQQTFKTPEDAVEALSQAVQARDRDKLRAIFGPRASELASGNAQQDEADMQRLAAALQRGYRFEDDGENEKDLLIGRDGWLFPAPLVKEGDAWRFDTDEGIEEVMDRRVGRNEINAIATSHYYVAAQELYHEMNPDKDDPPTYASKLLSSPGKHDGLYWPTKDDEKVQPPMGPLVEAALEAGHLKEPTAGQRQPYQGYFFKVLTRQGPAAPGGEKNYMDANGKMTGGFALVAWPEEHGKTGVMTFIIGKDGVAYQADLGEDTQKSAESMTTFNPDDKWAKVPSPTTAPAATPSSVPSTAPATSPADE